MVCWEFMNIMWWLIPCEFHVSFITIPKFQPLDSLKWPLKFRPLCLPLELLLKFLDIQIHRKIQEFHGKLIPQTHFFKEWHEIKLKCFAFFFFILGHEDFWQSRSGQLFCLFRGKRASNYQLLREFLYNETVNREWMVDEVPGLNLSCPFLEAKLATKREEAIISESNMFLHQSLFSINDNMLYQIHQSGRHIFTSVHVTTTLALKTAVMSLKDWTWYLELDACIFHNVIGLRQPD